MTDCYIIETRRLT